MIQKMTYSRFLEDHLEVHGECEYLDILLYVKKSIINQLRTNDKDVSFSDDFFREFVFIEETTSGLDVTVDFDLWNARYSYYLGWSLTVASDFMEVSCLMFNKLWCELSNYNINVVNMYERPELFIN